MSTLCRTQYVRMGLYSVYLFKNSIIFRVQINSESNLNIASFKVSADSRVVGFAVSSRGRHGSIPHAVKSTQVLMASRCVSR